MTQDVVIDIMRNAIMCVIVVSAPPLIMGLVVGILVSIFQAVTSIQEPTLAFVPKILAVFLSLIIFGPWMLTNLQEHFYNLYANFSSYVTPK